MFSYQTLVIRRSRGMNFGGPGNDPVC